MGRVVQIAILSRVSVVVLVVVLVVRMGSGEMVCRRWRRVSAGWIWADVRMGREVVMRRIRGVRKVIVAWWLVSENSWGNMSGGLVVSISSR